MKGKAMGLIGCLENMFAEWKTVREALMFTLVWCILVFRSAEV